MGGSTTAGNSDKLWKFSEGLTSTCVVGALWFLCSLPIVTVGAATTAMYTVFLRNIRSSQNRKEYVKPFFAAFKQDFKKSTILWLIQLAASAAFGLDTYYYLCMNAGGRFHYALGIVMLCLLAFVIMIFCYAFPLTALYRNTVRETLMESVQYACRNWAWSLLALAVSVAVPFVLTKGLWYFALIAGGAVGFANSYIMGVALKHEIPRGHGVAKF